MKGRMSFSFRWEPGISKFHNVEGQVGKIIVGMVFIFLCAISLTLVLTQQLCVSSISNPFVFVCNTQPFAHPSLNTELHFV